MTLLPSGTSVASFIGVDLAWRGEGRNSGLAAFLGSENGAEAMHVGEGAQSLDAVLEFILRHEAETTAIAIDAPLIIENPDGQRPCETLVSRRFGRAHASAHTSNLKRFPNAASVELVRRLEEHGFRHCLAPDAPWNREGRWFFEVYPHPAQVVLFQRDRIISYKKGTVAAKRLGLEELRAEICGRLVSAERFWPTPSLREFLSVDLESLRGRTLKHYEDALDAIMCSYLAFHLWRWGWQRSELLGDLTSGYIVVPSVPLTR
jgi:predicted RNase H-like nuclease